MQDYIQGMNWKGVRMLLAKTYRPDVSVLSVSLADIPASSVAADSPPGDCVRFSWSSNNCAYQADAMISATVLTIRPVLQPGEILYDRIKAIVPACIGDFDRLIKFGQLNWPAAWAAGTFHSFGDQSGKALVWTERLEIEMSTDGIRLYLPYFGEQFGLTWVNSWKYFEGMRIDEQKPEIRRNFDRRPVK